MVRSLNSCFNSLLFHEETVKVPTERGAHKKHGERLLRRLLMAQRLLKSSRLIWSRYHMLHSKPSGLHRAKEDATTERSARMCVIQVFEQDSDPKHILQHTVKNNGDGLF